MPRRRWLPSPLGQGLWNVPDDCGQCPPQKSGARSGWLTGVIWQPLAHTLQQGLWQQRLSQWPEKVNRGDRPDTPGLSAVIAHLLEASKAEGRNTGAKGMVPLWASQHLLQKCHGPSRSGKG